MKTGNLDGVILYGVVDSLTGNNAYNGNGRGPLWETEKGAKIAAEWNTKCFGRECYVVAYLVKAIEEGNGDE